MKEATGTNAKVDGDFPSCTRQKKKTTTITTQEKTTTSKENEEEDSNTTTSMEMCHNVWEKSMKYAKTAAAAIITAQKDGERKQHIEQHERKTRKQNYERMQRSVQRYNWREKQWKKEHEKQRHRVYRAAENMRSMHSSERVEEIVWMQY